MQNPLYNQYGPTQGQNKRLLKQMALKAMVQLLVTKASTM